MGLFNWEIYTRFLVGLIAAFGTCWGLTDPRDVVAINNLYGALGSPPLPRWVPTGGDPCAEGWQGVLCVNANITGIVLNGANLGGVLGESLGVFASITQMLMIKHLEESLDDWLTEELDNFADDDYIVFDCPGQIELFSHVPVFKNFVEYMKRKNFNVCVVYLLDSQFMTDVAKFISGCLASLSAMVLLELPHVNILSKMDLVRNKRDIEDYLNPEPQTLLAELNQWMAPHFGKLNKSLIELISYKAVRVLNLEA